MPSTIRERIIQAFAANLAGLSNLPIERCQRSIGESKERFVSVWDGEDRAESDLYGIQVMQFPLAVECIWQYDDENPSASANAVMGEIIALVSSADATYGGLATDTVLSVASPNYPADGGNYVTVTVIFNISYSTVKGDPCTVPA